VATLVQTIRDAAPTISVGILTADFLKQRFGQETPRRLERARRLTEAAGRDILIAVDGGISKANVADVARLGPDLIVTGSAIFDGVAPEENAREMLRTVQSAC